MIDLKPADLALLKAILQQQLPLAKVWAFGSRVSGQAKPYSDLDLAIDAAAALPEQTRITLLDVLQNSNLPFRVDIVDWHQTTEVFKAIIEQQRVALY